MVLRAWGTFFPMTGMCNDAYDSLVLVESQSLMRFPCFLYMYATADTALPPTYPSINPLNRLYR